MLKQLKRLFGRSHPASGPKPPATAANSRASSPATPPRAITPRSPALAPEKLPPGFSPDVNAEDISIPLQSVLNNLPLDLKSCVVPMDLGGATLTVTLHKILSELPAGAVTLSFGVLRNAAPQLFSIGDVWDQRNIELPLNELLVRVHPSLLPQSPAPAAANTDVQANSFIQPSVTTPSPRTNPTQPASGPMRVPVPTTAPTPVEASPSSDDSASDTITIPLAALTASWPSAVQTEIAQLNCAAALVTLPEALVQAKMKLGRVAFTWQAIRGWLQPATQQAVSKHDDLELDLPLEVIMPLFISRLKQSQRTQSRLVVDESIPALFGPATEPEPADPDVANTAAVTANSSDSALKTPSTDFKNRYISPLELVTLAAGLEGVAGALAVLPEGLAVASKIAPEQDPDAMAAFLARAFSRINQCAEDAQIGGLTQLTFIAQDIPWQIFRLQGVLFAAFGWAGGTLPTPQLAALAGEFDQKKQN